ncbi:MAG TPA: ACT domain-containing protein [Eubacteriaceae bacterium]|nr:ACT domain-containing protein [Eubacteriaceae bacterium]
MLKKYLIVNKEILPSYYMKVLDARTLLESGKAESVSEAVREVGISRSTYYKYKDFIFSPSQEWGRKATISFTLEHKKGVLSQLLNYIAEQNANVLTINQDIPINKNAIVNVTVDILDMDLPIDAFIQDLRSLDGVSRTKLLALE